MQDRPTDLLQGAREFLRQRDDYRERLRGELAEAEARVEEIKSLLRELAGADPVLTPAQKPRDRRTAPPADASIPDVIKHVVRTGPTDGMGPGDIVRAVIELRPSIKNTTVYPTLYRMRDDKRLILKGERYRLPDAEDVE